MSKKFYLFVVLAETTALCVAYAYFICVTNRYAQKMKGEEEEEKKEEAEEEKPKEEEMAGDMAAAEWAQGALKKANWKHQEFVLDPITRN